MNTTALLVDILIVGFQVLVWMSAIVFSLLIDPARTNQFLNNSPTSALFIIIIISYSLGIIFDYIIGTFFSKIRSKKEKKTYEDFESIKIIAGDPTVHKYLDNHHQRMKIARGTLFNLPLLTISAIVFILNVNVALIVSKSEMVWTTLIFGIALFILAWISWKERNKRYLEFVQQIKNLKWYKEYLASKGLKSNP